MSRQQRAELIELVKQAEPAALEMLLALARSFEIKEDSRQPDKRGLVSREVVRCILDGTGAMRMLVRYRIGGVPIRLAEYHRSDRGEWQVAAWGLLWGCGVQALERLYCDHLRRAERVLEEEEAQCEFG